MPAEVFMARPFIITLAAGAALTVGTACATGTPDALPTFDQVQSSHPPGATNPPIPALRIDAATDCATILIGRRG